MQYGYSTGTPNLKQTTAVLVSSTGIVSWIEAQSQPSIISPPIVREKTV